MRLILITFALTAALTSCDKTQINDDDTFNMPDYSTEYNNLNELLTIFDEYANIQDINVQDSAFQALMDSMKIRNDIPYTDGENALFIYYGDANQVAWAGDFTGWSPENKNFQGERLQDTKLFTCQYQFPADARLDYKIVTNGSNWKLDQRNNFIQYSGFGPNSELRMPEWTPPEETTLWEGVERGNFTDNVIIQSQELGYKLQYRVYTPNNYEQLDNLPVIYVTDGHEYADERLGAMLIVMDNLISRGDIEPLIAVFIDPRNPDKLAENRRAAQYRSNSAFVSFVTEELIPEIDNSYKTNINRDARAMLGTSYGGWNSAYFGLKANDYFKFIAMHSPAFDDNILNAYSDSEKLPIDIYMSTGLIGDTEHIAVPMKALLEQKSYNYKYTAVNQGHSWGNWCALIDEPLIFFFGK